MNFRSRPHWTCQGWMKLSGEGKNMAQDIQLYERDDKSSDILCIIKRTQLFVQKCVPKYQVPRHDRVGPNMLHIGDFITQGA